MCGLILFPLDSRGLFKQKLTKWDNIILFIVVYDLTLNNIPHTLSRSHSIAGSTVQAQSIAYSYYLSEFEYGLVL